MQKNNNSFILIYFKYLFISCTYKKKIIHSFWSTFVKDLKRNFFGKIYKKPHKNSKKIGFFLYMMLMQATINLGLDSTHW
jgi:hypothetical protein